MTVDIRTNRKDLIGKQGMFPLEVSSIFRCHCGDFKVTGIGDLYGDVIIEHELPAFSGEYDAQFISKYIRKV